MYDRDALLDIHGRAHESLRRLIAFCSTRTAEELNRPLPGFGFPTVLRQLEHTIGAEVYWKTVVTRGYSEEARMPALPDVAAIEAFREQTASVTRRQYGGSRQTLLKAGAAVADDVLADHPAGSTCRRGSPSARSCCTSTMLTPGG